jgi:hypothetical protein
LEIGGLTKPIFAGISLLTLAGFALMGIGLSLGRQKRVGVPAAYALMGMGTVLVFAGIYFAPPVMP